MVMVVVNSIFVASRRSNRLDTPQKIVVDEDAKSVVHGLSRNGTDVGLGDVGHFVRRHVWLTRDRAKDSDALGGCLNAALAKLIDRTGTH